MPNVPGCGVGRHCSAKRRRSVGLGKRFHSLWLFLVSIAWPPCKQFKDTGPYVRALTLCLSSEHKPWKRSTKLKPYLRWISERSLQFRFHFSLSDFPANAMQNQHFVPKRLWYKKKDFYISPILILPLHFTVFLVLINKLEFKATSPKFSMIFSSLASFLPLVGCWEIGKKTKGIKRKTKFWVMFYVLVYFNS